MKKFLFGLTFLSLATLFTTSCDPVKSAEPGSLTLEFEHVFGSSNEAFNLQSWYVHPMTGDSLNFSMLKYYISNVTLTAEDGTTWEAPESYYLIDASNPTSALVTLEDVPANQYTGLSFVLGVDSLHNISGAQTGALDPANGMFWSWNTGYIFVKVEGSSPQAAMGEFQYHLGGFSGENNAIQSLAYSFGSNSAIVEKGANPMVHMMFNVGKLWHGMPSVATTPMVHMPGANAVVRMEALATGISFEHLHN